MRSKKMHRCIYCLSWIWFWQKNGLVSEYELDTNTILKESYWHTKCHEEGKRLLEEFERDMGFLDEE